MGAAGYARMMAAAAAEDVFAAARYAYLAIATRSGPHVTPEAFVARQDRIWVVTRRGSVKAKVLGRRPSVGVLVRDGNGGAVVAAGQAAVLDLFRPTGLLSAVPEALLSGPVLAGYTLRHLEDLAAVLADELPGRLPGPRVVVAVRPDRVAVLDGDEVVHQEGDWEAGALLGGAAGAGDDDAEVPDEVPDDLADVVAEPGPVAVGWLARDGFPVALPGAWDPEGARAAVPATLVRLAGLPPSSPACLTFDRSSPGVSGEKRGLVLRGEGRLHVGERAWATVDAEKLTTWRGTETTTTEVR